MVDILGTSGHLEATTNLLQKLLDDSSLSSWMVILSACRLHGYVDVAKDASPFIIKLEQQKETLESFVGFFFRLGVFILLIWRIIRLHCTFFVYKDWLEVLGFHYLSLERLARGFFLLILRKIG